jgi:predicted TIM-barrel fold metal-dependent hydrolase
MGWPDRASPTNFSFNHIGHFAASGELLSKALFFGGVTHRHPALRFAFLEGGVGVACRVYADLVSHWQRRGHVGLANLDPRRVDIDEAMALLDRHGGTRSAAHADAIRRSLERRQSTPALQDDFALAGIESVADIAARFADAFAFGAEADDPLTPWAFARSINPGGVQLRVFFGSDIGHWDVLDFREPLVEAYEQVEHDLISSDDFRAFVFDNAARVYGTNPDFFRHAPFALGGGAP